MKAAADDEDDDDNDEDGDFNGDEHYIKSVDVIKTHKYLLL